jgi:hypothetical protein
MHTPSEHNETGPRVERHAKATAVVHVGGIERAEAERLFQRARAAASASAHGPIDIAESYDERAARQTMTASGSLPSVLRLLNGKSASGERLFADAAQSSMVASVTGVGSVKAVAINDHLLSAAKNHPPGDSPLEVRTEHDEPRALLHVKLTGSLYATSHLLFLVNLHLTQSRT